MSLLRDSDREAVQKRLESLHGRVRLLHFTQGLECEYCPEAKQLLEEVAALSDKVTLQVFNLQTDRDEAEKLGIDKVPATAVLGEKDDYGIRFYGLTSGYEFGSLLETMHRVSGGASGLEEASKQRLHLVHEPVLLQVFVTPT